MPSEVVHVDGMDSRRHDRKAVNLQATVEYLDPDGGWYPVQAWVTEVSEEGLRLKVPNNISISVKDVLRVYIHKHGIETTGKVRHVTDSSGSHVVVAVGLRLTEMCCEHWELWQKLTKA